MESSVAVKTLMIVIVFVWTFGGAAIAGPSDDKVMKEVIRIQSELQRDGILHDDQMWLLGRMLAVRELCGETLQDNQFMQHLVEEDLGYFKIPAEVLYKNTKRVQSIYVDRAKSDDTFKTGFCIEHATKN